MINKVGKVLVTGGAGCIGIQICKELLSRDIPIRLFDLPEQILRVEKHIPKSINVYGGSIMDCSALRDAMADCGAIIHLAAYLGVRRTEVNRLRCIEININGTKNVLDCAIQHKVKKIVFASSSEVYGEPMDNPVNENTYTQGKSVYAITKLAGEELIKAYNQRYPETTYTILRYFNTFGPYQSAQFAIPKFIKNILEDKPPIVYGDGQQMRSYCYSTDTALATVEALLNPRADGETINVGNSNQPINLLDLANLIIKACNKDGKVYLRHEKLANSDRSPDREIFNRYCSTEKARKILGYIPKVSLEEGIKEVVKHGVIFHRWPTADLSYTIDE